MSSIWPHKEGKNNELYQQKNDDSEMGEKENEMGDLRKKKRRKGKVGVKASAGMMNSWGLF